MFVPMRVLYKVSVHTMCLLLYSTDYSFLDPHNLRRIFVRNKPFSLMKCFSDTPGN